MLPDLTRSKEGTPNLNLSCFISHSFFFHSSLLWNPNGIRTYALLLLALPESCFKFLILYKLDNFMYVYFLLVAVLTTIIANNNTNLDYSHSLATYCHRLQCSSNYSCCDHIDSWFKSCTRSPTRRAKKCLPQNRPIPRNRQEIILRECATISTINSLKERWITDNMRLE